MIKLVAFDWNGTLFSDALACVESVNQVLKLFNIKPVTVNHFREHFDVPVTRSYLGLGIPQKQLEDRAEEIVKTFHENYEKRAVGIRTRAYTRDLLKWLAEHSIESIIFSNHIDEAIKPQLKRLKIENYFSSVLANSELTTSLKGRNKKEKLRDYIALKNLKSAEVLVVGDTIEEVEIGKELGLITVAITNGFCSTKRLKNMEPDYLIDNLKQVIDIIKRKSIRKLP